MSPICKTAIALLLALAATGLVMANADGGASSAIVADAPHLKDLAVSDKAITFSRIHYTRPFVDALFGMLIYGTMLWSGWAARFQNKLRRLTSNLAVQVTLYYATVAVIAFLVCLPYVYFYSHWLAVQFDVTSMNDVQWLLERCKRFAVSTVIGIMYWNLFYWIYTKFKHRWNMVLFAVLAPVSALFVLVWPLVVDPIFNKFTPLEEGPLRTKIEALAVQSGIPQATILVADKSAQTKQMNAYVTGIGPSARIVLWDTIIAKMPPDELLTVVGHEIGHYVKMHIYKGFALSMLGVFLALLAAGKFAPALLKLLPRRWGGNRLSDLTTIPLLGLLSAHAVLLISPIESSISRAIEHESDVYSLELTQAPTSLANAFITLSQEDLIDPHPPEWIEFWFFSHPSLGKRIQFAQEHKK